MNFMSKTLMLLVAIVMTIASCKHQPDRQQSKEGNYLSISGKITNPQADTIGLFTFDTEEETIIKVNSDGTFSGTFDTLKPDMVFLNHGSQYRLFAKNGYNLYLTWDATNLDKMKETIKFSGYGSDIVNYFNSAYYSHDFAETEERFKLSKLVFEQKTNEFYAEQLRDIPKSDPGFTAYYTDFLQGSKESDFDEYESRQHRSSLIGQLSPKFVDYENADGSKTSLDDFKGKYVYIDIWATWCTPCKAEIPYLQALEKAYHGKNIEFVSISVDSQDDKDTWKEMVEDEELTGVQLITDNAAEVEFTRAYQVDGIPHFMLIDPEGKIVSSTAPRPSDSKAIKELFEQLAL